MRVRRDKLERMRERGVDPYPVRFPRTTTLAELRARFPDLEPDATTGEQRRGHRPGRALPRRRQALLRDAPRRHRRAAGDALAGRGRRGVAGRWKSDVDLGDHVGVEGEVISPARRALGARDVAGRWRAKALRPLPDKHKGLTDPEARVRQRYVDLAVNADARQMVRNARDRRSSRCATTLDRHDFLEVETPLLQPMHGGAAARPFRTHLNAFDQRRCTCGSRSSSTSSASSSAGSTGSTRSAASSATRASTPPTAPSSRCSRSTRRTATTTRWPTLTRDSCVDAARALGSHRRRRRPRRRDRPRRGSGARLPIHERGVRGRRRGDHVPTTPRGAARRSPTATTSRCSRRGTPARSSLELYEQLVEHTLLQPTFVCDYPAAVRPLARPHRSDPRLVEAWDLIIGGVELGAGFLRAHRPGRAARRLVEQSLQGRRRRPRGDAARRGLPAGAGVRRAPAGRHGHRASTGLMLLTGVNIREAILSRDPTRIQLLTVTFMVLSDR